MSEVHYNSTTKLQTAGFLLCSTTAVLSEVLEMANTFCLKVRGKLPSG